MLPQDHGSFWFIDLGQIPFLDKMFISAFELLCYHINIYGPSSQNQLTVRKVIYVYYKHLCCLYLFNMESLTQYLYVNNCRQIQNCPRESAGVNYYLSLRVSYPHGVKLLSLFCGLDLNQKCQTYYIQIVHTMTRRIVIYFKSHVKFVQVLVKKQPTISTFYETTCMWLDYFEHQCDYFKLQFVYYYLIYEIKIKFENNFKQTAYITPIQSEHLSVFCCKNFLKIME